MPFVLASRRPTNASISELKRSRSGSAARTGDTITSMVASAVITNESRGGGFIHAYPMQKRPFITGDGSEGHARRSQWAAPLYRELTACRRHPNLSHPRSSLDPRPGDATQLA